MRNCELGLLEVELRNPIDLNSVLLPPVKGVFFRATSRGNSGGLMNGQEGTKAAGDVAYLLNKHPNINVNVVLDAVLLSEEQERRAEQHRIPSASKPTVRSRS